MCQLGASPVDATQPLSEFQRALSTKHQAKIMKANARLSQSGRRHQAAGFHNGNRVQGGNLRQVECIEASIRERAPRERGSGATRQAKSARIPIRGEIRGPSSTRG